jgi:hypothetical protein
MANPPYVQPINVQGVKSHLVGLDNWLAIAGQSFAGNYTDTKISQTVIPASIARFERETQWLVQPCQVVAFPDGTYDNVNLVNTTVTAGATSATQSVASTTNMAANQTLYFGPTIPAVVQTVNSSTSVTLFTSVTTTTGMTVTTLGTQDITATLPLRIEAPYPYDPDEIRRGYMVQTLRHRPATVVQRVRLMLGPNQPVLTLPPEWYRLDFKSGRVWQIPYSGSAITAIVAFDVLTASLIGGGRILPTAVACDYQCGLRANWWDPTNSNYDPSLADLVRVLEEYAAYYILQDISQAVNAGMQSVSIGARGFGQNQAYDRFEKRKEELYTSFTKFQETLHEQETPILIDFI